MTENSHTPGPIVLIGSGETSPASGTVFEKLARRYEPPLRIAVLETPAGFELNSSRVAGRVGDFLSKRLQNYNPIVDVIPARKKGGEDSPDNEAILEPLYSADLIFLGPGSPTYTARQLEGSLAYEIIQARQQTGASLVLASAATIAFGVQTLPVYEIFKAGMDLHWQPGLDFFRQLGLNLVIIPHWNNTQGGSELDTSHCFMGTTRFEKLQKLLTGDETILGIDEHTSLWIDPIQDCQKTYGKGQIHILRAGSQVDYESKKTIPMAELGQTIKDIPATKVISDHVWKKINKKENSPVNSEENSIPEPISVLIQQRDEARQAKDFIRADAIRSQVSELGWSIEDTPLGGRARKQK